MAAAGSRYDRERAVSYAHAWAHGRNPQYYSYDNLGGDCTNFASQCIFAGARVMNYSRQNGWYYRNANDKSPSWTGVEQLYAFLTRAGGGRGPYAVEVAPEKVMPGDIVQLSFDGRVFKHTPVVVAVGPGRRPGSILVAAHTFDCDNRPLDTYTYKKARFIHIVAVRLQ